LAPITIIIYYIVYIAGNKNSFRNSSWFFYEKKNFFPKKRNVRKINLNYMRRKKNAEWHKRACPIQRFSFKTLHMFKVTFIYTHTHTHTHTCNTHTLYYIVKVHKKTLVQTSHFKTRHFFRRIGESLHPLESFAFSSQQGHIV